MIGNTMDVLYVTGSCLTRNTSANLSHNAFVQGLIEQGCNVDIVMAKDSWGESDKGLPIWEKARYFVYPSKAFHDKLRERLKDYSKGASPKREPLNNSETEGKVSGEQSFKEKIYSWGKSVFYGLFQPDPLYPLEKYWLKTASHFKSDTKYDLVISNSSPAASHRLVVELQKKNQIRFKRWIQIWEDPWFHDLYGEYPEDIEKEEHSLLLAASEIWYVSPLTLMYQKKYYPDCSDKMHCLPLPAFDYSDNQEQKIDEMSFGYFGDYYSATRNIEPFYEAVKSCGVPCYIYGDTDMELKPTDRIVVSGRVTLDKLKTIQDNTKVLVHLSNIRGGQIPGKIYHYSVTNKPILFILDGTNEEAEALRQYFEPFKRYYFCDNNVESIKQAIEIIVKENAFFKPLKEFLPVNVVEKLLQKD